MGTNTLMTRSTPSIPRQSTTSSWSRKLPLGHMYGTNRRTFFPKSFHADWFSLESPNRGCKHARDALIRSIIITEVRFESEGDVLLLRAPHLARLHWPEACTAGVASPGLWGLAGTANLSWSTAPARTQTPSADNQYHVLNDNDLLLFVSAWIMHLVISSKEWH